MVWVGADLRDTQDAILLPLLLQEGAGVAAQRLAHAGCPRRVLREARPTGGRHEVLLEGARRRRRRGRHRAALARQARMNALYFVT